MSGQAVWVSYRPLLGWGARLYTAPLLGSAGPKDAPGFFRR